MRWTWLFFLLLGGVGVACGGSDGVLPDSGALPDAEGDAGDARDSGDPGDAGVGLDGSPPLDGGPPPATEVTVSGQVLKLGAFLAGSSDIVEGASVLAYGVHPPRSVISDASGRYTLRAPANGQVLLFAN